MRSDDIKYIKDRRYECGWCGMPVNKRDDSFCCIDCETECMTASMLSWKKENDESVSD